MPTYQVVPFVANVKSQEGSKVASKQLQELCDKFATDGWEFMGLENVETNVAGDEGCFGIGAIPSKTTSHSMAVFKK